MSNLDRMRKDLDRLSNEGDQLVAKANKLTKAEIEKNRRLSRKTINVGTQKRLLCSLGYFARSRFRITVTVH